MDIIFCDWFILWLNKWQSWQIIYNWWMFLSIGYPWTLYFRIKHISSPYHQNSWSKQATRKGKKKVFVIKHFSIYISEMIIWMLFTFGCYIKRFPFIQITGCRYALLLTSRQNAIDGSHCYRENIQRNPW